MSNSAENKLRKLGERVRSGLSKLHPVTEKQLAEVRKAVELQWQQKQNSQKTGSAHKNNSGQTKQKAPRQKPSQSQSDEQSQGY